MGVCFLSAPVMTRLFLWGRNVLADNASPRSGTRPGDGPEGNCEKKDKIGTGRWDLTASCCILLIYAPGLVLAYSGVHGSEWASLFGDVYIEEAAWASLV